MSEARDMLREAEGELVHYRGQAETAQALLAAVLARQLTAPKQSITLTQKEIEEASSIPFDIKQQAKSIKITRGKNDNG